MSDDGERGPPRVTITALSDDQVAMLAVFGQDGARRHPSANYFEDTPAGLAKLDPGISANVIRQYMCPVVTFRERPFMILPNGDLREIERRGPIIYLG